MANISKQQIITFFQELRDLPNETCASTCPFAQECFNNEPSALCTDVLELINP